MNKWKKKSSIMRRYDLTAKMYEMRYAEEQEAKYKVALESVRINRSSLILDLGCGSGLLFRHVAKQVQIVVGVDISKELLFQAKKREIEFENVHLIQADADYLPFKNNCFNIVFAFTMLQNLPKPMQTLAEIIRNTINNATVVVTGLKKVFSLEYFEMILKKSGLKVILLKNVEQPRCYIAITFRN